MHGYILINLTQPPPPVHPRTPFGWVVRCNGRNFYSCCFLGMICRKNLHSPTVAVQLIANPSTDKSRDRKVMFTSRAQARTTWTMGKAWAISQSAHNYKPKTNPNTPKFAQQFRSAKSIPDVLYTLWRR